MKLLLWSLAFPFFIISLIAEKLDINGVKADINFCMTKIENSGRFPRAFIEALIVAEDHRYSFHPGLDVLAVIRAILSWITRSEIQGASTIEQQFVRVVTGRYERTISRKFHEQLLALCVARRATKLEVASAYLSIAYYGSECVGLKGLTEKFGIDMSKISFTSALHVMVQLKYPRPRNPDSLWIKKVDTRFNKLSQKFETVNKNTPALTHTINSKKSYEQ